MSKWTTGWKIVPAIGGLAFLIGLTTALGVQSLAPDVVGTVTNGPQRSADHNDGEG